MCATAPGLSVAVGLAAVVRRLELRTPTPLFPQFCLPYSNPPTFRCTVVWNFLCPAVLGGGTFVELWMFYWV